MSQVEVVALWAGLIASIVSSVLSVVAIWFAVHVNTRSETVSDQTIRSLQKIESFVQRVSEDTSGLVKAAWDKMLGSFQRSEPQLMQSVPSTAKELASGLTAELKTEIAEEASPNDHVSVSALTERLEKAIGTWEKALEQQIAASRRTDRSRDVYGRYRTLSKLSPEAREIVLQIQGHHLTRPQYRALLASKLDGAMKELRDAGLLVPLAGHEGEKEVPVYWFPPGSSANIRQGLMAASRNDPEARELVRKALKNVGYAYLPPEDDRAP